MFDKVMEMKQRDNNIKRVFMSPKEKAKELVMSYWEIISKTDLCPNVCSKSIDCQHSWYKCVGWLEIAKKSAIVAVDQILETNIDVSIYGNQFSIYWNEVKKQINEC